MDPKSCDCAEMPTPASDWVTVLADYHRLEQRWPVVAEFLGLLDAAWGVLRKFQGRPGICPSPRTSRPGGCFVQGERCLPGVRRGAAGLP